MRERRPFRMQFPVAIVATTLLSDPVTVRPSRYGHGSGPTNRTLALSTASTGGRPCAGRAPDRIGPLFDDACPDCRNAGYRDDRTVTGPCNRSAKPVWTCGRAKPDAGVVDGQHRLMSPVHGGRPDRIGSLFDDACPTAVTPDTGLTERLPDPRTGRTGGPGGPSRTGGPGGPSRTGGPGGPSRTGGPGGPGGPADRPTGGPVDRGTGRPPACLRRGSRPPSRGDSGRHQLGTNRSRARGSGRKRRSARGGGERSSRRALNRNKGCVREARRRKQTDQKADGEEAEAWEDIEGSRTIRWGHGRRTGRRRRARTTRCAARRRR